MGVYAPEDYVIYIGLLVGIAWFLKKYFFDRVAFDQKLIYALAPYIPLGIFVRLLVDVGEFEANKLWSITPGVYVLMMAIIVFSSLAGKSLEKRHKTPYWYLPAGMGIALLVPVSYILLGHMQSPGTMVAPLLMAGGITAGVGVLAKILGSYDFYRKENLAIVFAHLLDGSATFLVLSRYPGFYEEHLLPRFLIELAGGNAFIMVPVKLVLILTVIYFLEKWHREEAEKDELTYSAAKLLLFILGIGPGVRDMFLPALLT